MSYLFQLQTNLSVLNQYGYIAATEEQLTEAIDNDWGEEIELESIPNNKTQEEFIKAFLKLLEEYELLDYANTLLFITLKEFQHFDTVLNNAYDTYNSKKIARQLAQLLICFQQTPQNQLLGLKLNTLTSTVKLDDNKLIAWIGSLIKKGLAKGNFSFGQLGEGVWHWIEPGANGLTFTEPLNYERIEAIANKTVRSPTLVVKKQTAYCLHRIWNFVDAETTLTRPPDVRYADKQLVFLFRLGEVLGWLNENTIDSDPKDYMYAFFTNYI